MCIQENLGNFDSEFRIFDNELAYLYLFYNTNQVSKSEQNVISKTYL